MSAGHVRSRIVALALAAHAIAGCAARDSSSSEPAYSSSGGATTTASESATSVQSTGSEDTATRAAPTVNYTMNTGAPRAQSDSVPGTRPSATGGASAPEQPQPMIARDDQIAQWQSRLAAIELQLQASAGVCRDVCRATDAICHAQRELCSLTGDREGAPPTDPRCARARVSCERAARQRQESCTSCPSE